MDMTASILLHFEHSNILGAVKVFFSISVNFTISYPKLHGKVSLLLHFETVTEE